MTPCPVCGQAMECERDFMGFTLMEETHVCPTHHYVYEYVTGSTRTRVGGREWHEHHADDGETFARVHAEIDAAIAALRETLR